MTKKRKRRSAGFKFQVALEAAKETKTINQMGVFHFSRRKGQASRRFDMDVLKTS